MTDRNRISPSNNGHDRDARGRFVRGNPGGPGRPRNPYRKSFHDELGDEAWRAIVRTAIELAKGGDVRMIEWIGNYAIGRPADMETREAVDELRERLEQQA